MEEVPSLSGVRPHILVAEDDPVSRRVAHLMLTRLGCEVDMAPNGREAVELASIRRYDLILMDCDLPELDGFGAARAIRAGGASLDTPIVAATSLDDWSRCKQAGMNDFLRKPIERADYLRILSLWVPSAAL